MKFEEKLILLRKQKGLSQEDLADLLNVSRQAVSRWELGTTLPDAPNLLALSDLFKVSIDYMLRDDYESAEDISNSIEPKTDTPRSKRSSHKWFLVAFVCWLVSALCHLCSAIINFVAGDINFGAMYISLMGVNNVFAVLFFVRYLKSRKSDKK